MPRVEKYDIKPYEPEDDDEYRTDAEKAELQSQLPGGGAVSGGVSRDFPVPRSNAHTLEPSRVVSEDGCQQVQMNVM